MIDLHNFFCLYSGLSTKQVESLKPPISVHPEYVIALIPDILNQFVLMFALSFVFSEGKVTYPHHLPLFHLLDPVQVVKIAKKIVQEKAKELKWNAGSQQS